MLYFQQFMITIFLVFDAICTRNKYLIHINTLCTMGVYPSGHDRRGFLHVTISNLFKENSFMFRLYFNYSSKKRGLRGSLG